MLLYFEFMNRTLVCRTCGVDVLACSVVCDGRGAFASIFCARRSLRRLQFVPFDLGDVEPRRRGWCARRRTRALFGKWSGLGDQERTVFTSFVLLRRGLAMLSMLTLRLGRVTPGGWSPSPLLFGLRDGSYAAFDLLLLLGIRGSVRDDGRSVTFGLFGIIGFDALTWRAGDVLAARLIHAIEGTVGARSRTLLDAGGFVVAGWAVLLLRISVRCYGNVAHAERAERS